MKLFSSKLKLRVAILGIVLTIQSAFNPLSVYAANGLGNMAGKLPLVGMGEDSPEDAANRQKCEQQTDKHDANDPCNSAHIKDEAGKAQAFSCMAYTMAFTICLSECIAPFTGGTACTAFGAAGLASDIFGSMLVGAEGQNMAENLKSSLPFMAAQVGGMTIGLASGDNSAGNKAAELEGQAKVAEKKGENEAAGELRSQAGTARDEQAKKEQSQGRKVACMGAFMNGAQAVIRGLNAKSSFESARADRRTRKEIEKTGMNVALTGDKANGEGSRAKEYAQQGAPGMKTGTTGEAKTEKQEDKPVESMISAGQGPLMKKFEEVTRSGGAQELFDRVGAGQPPLLAAAEMAGGTLGAEGLSAAAQIHGTANAMADTLKDKLDEMDKKTGITNTTYASVTGHRSPAGGGGGDAMPDISAIMAQFMPKKPEEAAKAQGVGGPLKAAPKLTSDGMHMPERSIFEVVSTRYLIVSQRFLNGDRVTSSNSSTATSPTLLPKNPYLRK